MAILLQRLCWNSREWREPTGHGYGAEHSYVGKNGFGHEEWNLKTTDLINGKVYGYTYYSPPTGGATPLGPHDIYFFAISPHPQRQRLLVGAYHNAHFLSEDERRHLKESLEGSDYLDRRAEELLALGLPNLRSEPDALELLKEFPLNVCVAPAQIETYLPPQELEPSDIGGRDPRTINRYTRPVFLDRSPRRAANVVTDASGSPPSPALADDLLVDSYVRFTPAQRRVIARRHNILSNQFKGWLTRAGAVEIYIEADSVDVSCVYLGKSCLFELKTCYNQSTRHALREALGQLMEYAFYPGRGRPDALAVVLDTTPSKLDLEWFRSLTKANIAVELFWLVGEEVYSAKLTKHPLGPKGIG